MNGADLHSLSRLPTDADHTHVSHLQCLADVGAQKRSGRRLPRRMEDFQSTALNLNPQ